MAFRFESTAGARRPIGLGSWVLPVALATAAALGAAVGLGGSAMRLALLSLAALAVPLLLVLPTFRVVEVALAALYLSRLGVLVGAPSAINHLHFPLLVLAAAMATRAPDRSPRRIASSIGVAAIGLLVIAVLSAIANGAGVAAATLVWLVFAEPFLLIYAIVRDPPVGGDLTRTGRLLIAFAVLQVPFAVWQAATLGRGDVVQGTFVAQGAGAHVMGAASVVAAVFVASTSVVRPPRLRTIVTVLLLLLPVLADAKQVLTLFIVAFAMVSAMRSPKYWRASLVGGVALAGMLALVVKYVPGWQLLTNTRLFVDGLAHKVGIFALIHSYFDSWSDWLLGIGPGNTVSRISLMALSDYGGRSSLLPRLGVDASPIATRLFAMDVESYLARSGTGSSAWSFVFSWAGLFGDLGLLGVASYLWLGFVVWRATRGLGADRRFNGAHITMMALALLAAVYTYLEEPGATLAAAGWIAFVIAERHTNGAGDRDSRARDNS